MNNGDVFLKVYNDVNFGQELRPRGQLCREVTDYQFTLDMSRNFCTSFAARQFVLKYACEEFLWYLRADKFDSSIEKHAKMWQKLRQPDGSYFSNYGQYIFPAQFQFVKDELTRDRDSRRASMVLLKQEHLFATNTDIVCTYAINFRIRNDRLDMAVMMRSNDVIFGTTNDVFCFSMLYRMMFALLSAETTLYVGKYTHFVNSLHVYERHFDMIAQILADGKQGYLDMFIPWPSREEVENTLKSGFAPNRGLWSSWMA